MIFLVLSLLFFVISFHFLKRNINKNLSKNQSNRKYNSSIAIDYCYCFSLWVVIFLISLLFFNSFLVQIPLAAISILITYKIFIYLSTKNFDAKKHLDQFFKYILFLATIIGILITILIIISIIFEAIKFFQIIDISKFIFGTNWSPQMSHYSDSNLNISDYFGVVPVIAGTLTVTFVAIFISAPIGIFSAIYISQYASKSFRNIAKPIIELLAGIPTVVYGYFAVTTISPFFVTIFTNINIEISAESGLVSGFVIGIMIIPFILSLCDDAMNNVPLIIKQGSLALGSTKSEMIRFVIIPYSFQNIISSILLAISRSIGETMIVTMAAGLVANMTINPLNSMTTATAQIVTLLIGDQEFDNPKTLAAFGIALILFIITLIFNIIAILISKKQNK